MSWPRTKDEIYQLIFRAILDRNFVVASDKRQAREMCLPVIGKKSGRAQALLINLLEEAAEV